MEILRLTLRLLRRAAISKKRTDARVLESLSLRFTATHSAECNVSAGAERLDP